MKNALIGFTGFVGSSINKQFNFDEKYNSSNIDDMEGGTFNMVVCAGAPGVKWFANQNPNTDRESIKKLVKTLKTITCNKIVLISTIDVFDNSIAVDELKCVDPQNLHPYGLHRYELEQFIQTNFKEYHIIRLPGLLGPNLRKNVVYDLKNKNNLNSIDYRAIYQFYPITNLWSDIQIAIKNNLPVVHFSSEPISVSEISIDCFNMNFDNELDIAPAKYGFVSKYTELFGGNGKYIYSKKEIKSIIRYYNQSD